MPWRAVIALSVALIVIIAGLLIWRSPSDDERLDLVLATGPEGGMYHTLGVPFGRMLERQGIARRVEVRTTQGSVENMHLLESGEADLAVVQSDTLPAVNARLIASLFDEELHVLVARSIADDIRSVLDLSGHRVSLGGLQSGTRQVAMRVLHHLDVAVGEDLALSPADAVTALTTGDIDAMFLLTAVPSPTVGRLARADAIRFASLGDPQVEGNRADALALVYPRLHATVIPVSTYGHLPQRPTLTVGVTAELMCTGDLDADVVGRITRAVFDARVDRIDLPEEATAIVGRIHERYVRGGGSVPYHPGATAYYERFEPPFIVEYAEAISLGLTLLVGAWSGWIALRQWIQRRKKNRIDAYYLEVTTDPPDLTTASREQLLARRARLIKIRERAFADLVAERLEADESFSIFQNQVTGELASIAFTLQHLGLG
jgi:TRAP transporter TAXI family solute receptor